MTNHVQGKVVVVTGAASGFGRLIVRMTAAKGAKVVAADVDEAGLRETVDGVVATGAEAVGRVTDVTDRADMTAMAGLAAVLS